LIARRDAGHSVLSRWLVAWLWLIAVASLASAQDLAPVPSLRARVTDLTGTLTAEQTARLEQTLQDFERRKGTQVVVLVVGSTKPEEIEQYSLRVVEQWKPGRKKIDDGALLIVAKDDRALRIEVGYGLEGVLTDATSHRIIDEVITPKFRAGDYAGGISAGVASVLSIIEGEPLPEPSGQRAVPQEQGIRQFLPVILVLALLIGGVLRAVFGRLPGAMLAGSIVGLLAWFFAGAPIVGALAGVLAFAFTLFGVGGHGGHYRGGYGGWRAGGLGGGGFSGGGGGFGGGGSSGRW
jgi:uncharacterized protein